MTKKEILNTTHLHDTRSDQIVSELHDGVCQQLVSMLWELESLKSISEQEERVRTVDSLAGQMRGVITELQQIIYNQRPILIDRLGLVAGLREWTDQQLSLKGIRFTFLNQSPKIPVSRLAEGQIFRMIQEGVHNIIRHAKATEVELSITQKEECLMIQLADNGRGFELDRRTGLGLQILQERAELIQGELVIITAPGEGTRLQILIPHKGDDKQ